MACQQPAISKMLDSRFNNGKLYQCGLSLEKKGMIVWPQDLEDPQYVEGCSAEGRGSLIRLSGLRPVYPEFMHPCSQGARVEAQDRGGPVSSFDAPACFR